MKKILCSIGLLSIVLFFNGCLVQPVEKSGGIGAVTVTNSNSTAIIAAAQTVFAQYGYTPGPMNYPDSVSFDKPAGKLGKIAYGSYGTTTTIRAWLTITQIPSTNNYRLSIHTRRVSDAGEAGFEESSRMSGLWAGEFSPLMKQIQAQASGAGQGY